MSNAINTSDSHVNGLWHMDIVSMFHSPVDKEIATIICAWVSIGGRLDRSAAEHILDTIMRGKPYEYVMSGEHHMVGQYNSNCSLYRQMTYGMFGTLVGKMQGILSTGGFMKHLRDSIRAGGYVHEALCKMLSGGTGFQTASCGSSFYRLNLIYYILSHNLGIWDSLDGVRVLVPCDERMMDCAYRMKYIGVKARTTLRNAERLTERIGSGDMELLYRLN